MVNEMWGGRQVWTTRYPVICFACGLRLGAGYSYLMGILKSGIPGHSLDCTFFRSSSYLMLL